MILEIKKITDKIEILKKIKKNINFLAHEE